MPNASFAPTGAEKTALKIIASRADASRTRTDDCLTKREVCFDIFCSFTCKKCFLTLKQTDAEHARFAYGKSSASGGASCLFSLTTVEILVRVYNIDHR